MSEEQNEVLEQQRYLLERRMCRLDPAPPKLPAQEYILNGDDCSDSCIQRIADETGMGEKSVRKYIAIGTLNERRVDFTGNTMRTARKQART